MDIHVFPAEPDGHRHAGTLVWRGRAFPCALGRGGITANKHEGDGATPLGTHPLRRVFYRADRRIHLATALETRPLTETDGWCDDPESKDYNTLIRLPAEAGHEVMWRDDHLYDIVVELGYNDSPVRKGGGSAIFMHVARPRFAATEGCVAMRQTDLIDVLNGSGPGDSLRVSPSAP